MSACICETLLLRQCWLLRMMAVYLLVKRSMTKACMLPVFRPFSSSPSLIVCRYLSDTFWKCAASSRTNLDTLFLLSRKLYSCWSVDCASSISLRSLESLRQLDSMLPRLSFRCLKKARQAASARLASMSALLAYASKPQRTNISSKPIDLLIQRMNSRVLSSFFFLSFSMALQAEEKSARRYNYCDMRWLYSWGLQNYCCPQGQPLLRLKASIISR